jgi:serine/threonine protein kinase
MMMTSLSVQDFIEGKAVPKFIDFGLSKVIIPGETSLESYGTLIYCSPEIVLGKPHTKKTDLWSMGIVLYAMLTDRMPFVTYDRKKRLKILFLKGSILIKLAGPKYLISRRILSVECLIKRKRLVQQWRRSSSMSGSNTE